MWPMFIYSLGNLDSDFSAALECFKQNGMVANPDKLQLMLLRLKGKSGLRINIEGMKMRVKVLGAEIDSKLWCD